MNDEHYSDKNVNNTFINKLKDFSTFNPSGNKGKEKINNSMMVMPLSTIDMKKRNKGSIVEDIGLGLTPLILGKEQYSMRNIDKNS